MKFTNTRLKILETKKELSQEVKTGVSLHCHTQFSREMLDFIPCYTEKIPIVNYFWQKERANYREREGKDINFESAYWSPPLSETEVYSIEQKQIKNLNLNPIVSISDHDNIEANLKICESTANEVAPISLEWTVPYKYGFFHLGVHNLPKSQALEISQKLLDYTFDLEIQNDERLHELFAMLNEMPEVLIILNHPLWDIEMIGQQRHKKLLKNFLNEHGQWLHAFEFNGFRSWSENKGVIELAESLGKPLCSGGDRHGCQPNTVLNLTNARTFSEFVDEVRNDKRTEVVLMPEYNQPLLSRQLQGFSEILSYYEHFPLGRKRWFDRVHFDVDGTGLRPLSDHGWKLGGPKWLRISIKILTFFGNPKLRPFFNILRKNKDVVPKSENNQILRSKDSSLATDNNKLLTGNK